MRYGAVVVGVWSKGVVAIVPMVNVPTPTMVAVWPAVKLPAMPATVKLETLRGVSASLSLPNTFPVATLSSTCVPVSAVSTPGALVAEVF